MNFRALLILSLLVLNVSAFRGSRPSAQEHAVRHLKSTLTHPIWSSSPNQYLQRETSETIMAATIAAAAAPVRLPICLYQGMKEEGWYWLGSNLLISHEKCGGLRPLCLDGSRFVAVNPKTGDRTTISESPCDTSVNQL
ncbi:hypothetical protein PAPYR_10 [Paratrimastix pyriformis]|uniref:Uncharacterized protein n=1 Tax=Paratrimastix pyriformis TaxID=342808 RepID=A0ABQ8UUM4_9EUKA|nr:hypothetical protein PAPYR_10 [Paratrimastix pyriformis]|eukprot:GAFH01005908.1.p2 GENE.GAFH01005908.1~~GAFH01005908.1.p2  ORF type:complete len:139 (-),score=8.46 GAFH01005908.1:123-539(-)